MYRFFLAAVDVVPSAVVLLPLFSILYCVTYHRDLRKSVLYLLFCLYLSAVFSLVGIPNVTYFRPEANLNLVPFAGIMKDLKNSLLNVLLFVPFGIFLPLLWAEFRKPTYVAAYGFCFSLAIELMQMLTFRATDVNDLITNTGGTLLGFVLVRPLLKRCLPMGKGRRDSIFLILLSFGIMFFIHPFLSRMIWDKLL